MSSSSLNNNLLTEIRNNTFQDLNNLGYLYLRDNLISSIDQGAFLGIKSGSLYLFLDRNMISRMPGDTLPSSIYYLYLSNNSLTEIRNNTFQDLTNLRELYMEGNIISYVAEAAFIGLTNLYKLRLNNNSLTEIRNKTFQDLTNLRELYLEGNIISYVEEGAFIGLTNLYRLNLKGNQLSTVTGGHFQNTALKYLQLAENPVACNCTIMNWYQWLNSGEEIGPSSKAFILTPEYAASGWTYYENTDHINVLFLKDCPLVVSVDLNLVGFSGMNV